MALECTVFLAFGGSVVSALVAEAHRDGVAGDPSFGSIHKDALYLLKLLPTALLPPVTVLGLRVCV